MITKAGSHGETCSLHALFLDFSLTLTLTKQAKINFLAANSIPKKIGQHPKNKTKVQQYIKFEFQVQYKPTNYIEGLINNLGIHTTLNATILCVLFFSKFSDF